MPLNLKTPAVLPAVSLVTAKAHLRVEHTEEDTLINSYINAAVQWVESRCQRSLVTRVYQLGLSEFSDYIELPFPPVQAGTVSVSYYDTDNALQTLASDQYEVQTWGGVPNLVPAYSVSYPETYSKPNAVIVEYSAGYGLIESAMPAPIVQALLLLIGHFYENREENIIGTISSRLQFSVDNLLAPYIVVRNIG